MDRRTAIKNLSLLGGALLMAPSCSLKDERVSLALDNLNISAAQEELMANVVDTLIPATEIPGAKELDVHQFVLVMVDDCRDSDDQQAFTWGLEQLDKISNHLYAFDFDGCSTSQREELVTGILKGDSEVKNYWVDNYQRARKFLNITKQYTIQGYLESEFVMTKVNPYQLVPGHFDGCVMLK